MENDLLQQLYERDQAESKLYHMERRRQALKDQIAQARYDQRIANTSVTEYKGSLRSFLDRFSGKSESRVEELTRQKRMADAKLDALLREQDTLGKSSAETNALLEQLPTREELISRAGDDPVFATELHRLAARFCVEALIPMLEENYNALLDMRDLMQGKMMRIISAEETQQIYTLPDTTGEACRLRLIPLEASMAGLGRPFQIPDYYRAPKAYIASAASGHLRRDRVNQALDQALETKKRISALLETLDD